MSGVVVWVISTKKFHMMPLGRLTTLIESEHLWYDPTKVVNMEYDSDNVRSNPNLSADEKETCIVLPSNEDEGHLHSDQRTVMKWMIDNPNVTVTNVVKDDEGYIVGVQSTLPVGLVSLKGSPRKTNHVSSVVSRSWEADFSKFD